VILIITSFLEGLKRNTRITYSITRIIMLKFINCLQTKLIVLFVNVFWGKNVGSKGEMGQTSHGKLIFLINLYPFFIFFLTHKSMALHFGGILVFLGVICVWLVC
jgi:hypothetical protein